MLELFPDDELRVVDPEGKQIGELAVFSPDGRPDTGALTDQTATAAAGLKSILGNDQESARQVAAGLNRRGIDVAAAQAVVLFAPDSRRRAKKQVLRPHAKSPAQSQPRVRECQLMNSRRPPPLWPGCTAPVNDPGPNQPCPNRWPIRVKIFELSAAPPADTRLRPANFFRSSMWLVVNVRIFWHSLREQLDRGLERGLDATTTRTLMGTGYPGPGLFSKFFDQDMQPLIEVVQDTCGRHDTFGLACTSKYYEDMGYFGHPNCSDNLSSACKTMAFKDVAVGRPSISFTTRELMSTMCCILTNRGRDPVITFYCEH